MTDLMARLIAAKEKRRKELAALPFSEKIRLTEKMRVRDALIAPARERNREYYRRLNAARTGEGKS